MNSLQKRKQLVLVLFLLAPCGMAWADWELDNSQSVINFVSIKNERMRELLFETVKFPSAQLTAKVEPAVLAEAAKGGVVNAELPVTLPLHGKGKTLTVPVVVGGADGSMRVFTARPVLVNAADFGLESGVTALQQVAGLKAISHAVPVTLQLLFVQAR